MGEKSSTIDADDVEEVVNFVLDSQKSPSDHPMLPWHIVRSIKNRLEKRGKDVDTITVNDSHMNMIISGVSRIFDEEDISEDTKHTMKRLHTEVNSKD
jgi:hypothetical protein